MNAPAGIAIATAFGTILEGGFYAGRVRLTDGEYAIIVAPKAAGEHKATPWNKSLKSVAGAMSFFDGLANTKAMADAGSKVAQWALDLSIGGFKDWYVPSRDELELCYRNLKPGTEENWCYRGDNPSSVPPGYAYMPEVPAQTEVEVFRDGGTEAFTEEWYWSSTQFAGSEVYAWFQVFGYGSQSNSREVNHYRVRAVRRVKI
jgi:hypothetical protein